CNLRETGVPANAMANGSTTTPKDNCGGGVNLWPTGPKDCGPPGSNRAKSFRKGDTTTAWRRAFGNRGTKTEIRRTRDRSWLGNSTVCGGAGYPTETRATRENGPRTISRGIGSTSIPMAQWRKTLGTAAAG